MTSRVDQTIVFTGPGVYRIVVKGALSQDDLPFLGGMTATISSDESHGPVTGLVGRLRDQAELSGILNTLYELHLPILSVRALFERPDRDKD